MMVNFNLCKDCLNCKDFVCKHKCFQYRLYENDNKLKTNNIKNISFDYQNKVYIITGEQILKK